MAHPSLKASPNMREARSSQRGYSLTEMLTVVAIIGIMSLIVVPNFVQYYRSIKLKTGMRRLANDLRAARQRAVTRNAMVMISYTPDVNPAVYTTYQSIDAGANWTQVGNTVQLDGPIYLKDSTTATLKLADAYLSDGKTDAVFKSDGTPVLPAGDTAGSILVKSKDKVAINTYTIDISATGKISAK